MRREVTAGQMFDLEAEFAETFIRKLDLSVFKGIFVAAAHQKRELMVISPEELTEVESVTLRLVISHEARCGGEVEQAIVTVQSSIELADFAICYPVAFGPHHPCQHEQGERTPQTPASPVRKAAQDRRCVPRVGVPVRKEPTIEDENATYVWPARGLASLGALESASQMLQDHKRGKVKGNQRRGLDGEIAPDGFNEIGAFGGGICIVLRLVAIAHAEIFDE